MRNILFICGLLVVLCLCMVQGKPDGKPGNGGGKRGGNGTEGDGKGPGGKGGKPERKGSQNVVWDHGTNTDNPKSFKEGNTHVRILGDSGAIAFLKHRCFNKTKGDATTGDAAQETREVCKQGKAIRIMFKKIVEVSKTSAAGVGKGGKKKHSTDRLNDAVYTFSVQKNITLPGGNVRATGFSYTGTIPDTGATMTVWVYIIRENGTISASGEEIQVVKGQVKISLELKGWSFCGDDGEVCDEGAGEYVDLHMNIKTPGTPQRVNTTAGGAVTYTVDDSGARIILATKAEVNGADVDLPEGYPLVTGNNYVFRFPKFNTVLYDPVNDVCSEDDADFSDPDEEDGNGVSKAGLSLATLLALLMAAILNL